MKKLILIFIVFTAAKAQQPASHISAGPILPKKCSYFTGDIFVLANPVITTNNGLYICGASNTFSVGPLVVASGSGTPIGVAGGALAGSYPNPILSNLTTVGAIPYVSANGVLNQDQTAGYQFNWNPTTHCIGIGISCIYALDIYKPAGQGGGAIRLNGADFGESTVFGSGGTGGYVQSNGVVAFLPNNTQSYTLNQNGTGTWANACVSAASPAVCGTTPVGAAVIAAAATSVLVNDAAVTASSLIVITEDESLGTLLSVTCNTQSSLVVGTLKVSARVGGASFTVVTDVAPTTNPICFSYHIFN